MGQYILRSETTAVPATCSLFHRSELGSTRLHTIIRVPLINVRPSGGTRSQYVERREISGKESRLGDERLAKPTVGRQIFKRLKACDYAKHPRNTFVMSPSTGSGRTEYDKLFRNSRRKTGTASLLSSNSGPTHCFPPILTRILLP